ncbi:hypothetical protein CMUST_05715 [Corynebacterium mustelae]|uniref:DUF4440 domain-containing protein n=1 Tax=Corynebacterium mustelae TaxID=571915 RepID=A0A0G3GWD6_9CORY|nr:hypothetical protein [Corynebacterium mustelae]AKK05479.1 hypothetical protein CMUST_05715 [Corynebacterium mustelae]
MSKTSESPEWHRELIAREPVLDHPEFIWDDRSFDSEIASDFAEIGASGTWYPREVIREVVLGRLAGTHATSLPGGYRIEDAQVIEITPDVAQVRYSLHAQGRVTRRTTLYRRGPDGWQAVFHQGTVVPNAIPLPPNHPEPRQA